MRKNIAEMMCSGVKKCLIISLTGVVSLTVHASGTMSESELYVVEKKKVRTDEQKRKLQRVAVTLANDESEANKLIDMVEEKKTRSLIDEQANKLMRLSEIVLDWARFRLVQCEAYLVKAIGLKNQLGKISHEALEKDYHHDGALPQAPPECYHMKDMFVHPASVLVLTRDDSEMWENTQESIKSEITEVLAHTEIVRQLAIY